MNAWKREVARTTDMMREDPASELDFLFFFFPFFFMFFFMFFFDMYRTRLVFVIVGHEHGA